MPDKNSAMVPPDSIPNSEVKRSYAEGSAGFPRVRLGNSQAYFSVFNLNQTFLIYKIFIKKFN